jgi:hypothetical protein
MSIPVRDLNSISKGDLDALVQNGATESNSLEFKRQAYGNTEADKKEFLKDVTAFANSMGGDLILGIDEQDGVAAGLVPLTNNPENEVDRLNQILRTGTDPPLLGVSVVAVQADSGACIIVRVPRSALAPHRVTAYNTSRFFVRHGRAAVEATIDELRNLFGRQREMNERARDFHERTIRSILSGNPSSRPQGTAASFILLQMFPLSSLTAAEPAVDFARPEFLKLPLYGIAMGRSVIHL